MKEYLTTYINDIEKKIDGNNISKPEIDLHIKKIAFFQHERLIHLLVTLFYAIFTLVFFALGMISWLFFIVDLILMIFLIFYILYYFFLENHVQYLYKLYDKMLEIEKTNKK